MGCYIEVVTVCLQMALQQTAVFRPSGDLTLAADVWLDAPHLSLLRYLPNLATEPCGSRGCRSVRRERPESFGR